MPTDKGFTRLWFGFVGNELSSADIAALRVTKESLQHAYEFCQENEIEFIVVFAPTKFRVYADICEFDDTSRTKEWTINDLPQRLSKQASAISKKIGFLDLTPDLRNAARQGEVLYFPTDTHWTPEGHRVAAHSISEFIRSDYPRAR